MKLLDARLLSIGVMALVLLGFARPAAAQTRVITGVSIPVNSMDAPCRPRNESVWSVGAPPYPLNVNSGIGYLINPTLAGGGDFVLHDHQYIAANVPNPERSVVTYTFDAPAVVDQLEIQQHANGISQVEGFVGNSLDAMVSIGTIFGPSGNVTGAGVLPEGGLQVFDFNNAIAGKYFKFVVRKTSLHDGYAAYRAYLRDSSGVRFAPAAEEPLPTETVPEPSSLVLFAAAGAVLLIQKRRRS